jgi:hypothetical protein
MSSKREQYRETARECVRIAELATDPTLRQILRQHAQEWLRLAYAEQDDRFHQVLAEFNAAHLSPRGPLQRQPEQQQQAKSKPDSRT